jgi:putative membrane protein
MHFPPVRCGEIEVVLPRLLLGWLSNVVALFVAAWLIPGIGYGDEAWALVLAGLVLALVNAVVRPIVVILTLPAVIVTLGLALLLVNALMLWLTDVIVPDFESGGFWSTLGGALVVWVVNLLLHGILDPERLGLGRRR